MSDSAQLSLNLISAAEDGDERLVRQLVQQGANVDYTTPDGDSPLMAACRGGHKSIIRCFVEELQANLNINVMNGGDGWTPLMYAGFYGHVGIVRYLIEQGADYTLRNADLMTVLEITPCVDATLLDVQEAVALGVQLRAEAGDIHSFSYKEPVQEPTSKHSVGGINTTLGSTSSQYGTTSTAMANTGTFSASFTAMATDAPSTEALARWRQSQPTITDHLDIASARPRLIQLYRSICSDFGAAVDERIEAALADSTMDIPEAGLGGFDLKSAQDRMKRILPPAPTPAVAKANEREKALRAVKVGDLRLLPLLEVLCHAVPNAPLHTIDLSYCNIGDVSMRALAVIVRQSENLAVLNLEGNNITNVGAQALAAVLVGQKSLRQLNLSNNPLGGEGGVHIAEALISGNDTLLSLDMSSTDLSVLAILRFAALLHQAQVPLARLSLDRALLSSEVDQVVPHLARALQHSRVQSLSLAKMGLGDDAAKWIAQYISTNNTITELNLRGNRISTTGTASLAYALRTRRCPCFVNLDANPLREQLLDEVFEVLDTEEEHIELLDHHRAHSLSNNPIQFGCLVEYSTGEPLDDEQVDRYSDLRHCLIARPFEN